MSKNFKKKKVIVAMSGGVDSSLAAALLKKESYEVLGVTMRLYNFEKSDNKELAIQKKDHIRKEFAGDNYEKNIESARKVAQKLGIPWLLWDFSKEFNDKVIDYFCEEYKKGRTPNPCVVCNLKIKFEFLLKRAISIGADYIATGHYTINEFDQANGKFLIKKGMDENKDQSYFLYRLNQIILPYVLFPLGKLRKNQTRELAQEFGLKNYKMKESQEICFIPDDNYRKFLTQHIKDTISPGKFKDKEGNILGEHQGIPFYTIGQRKKLGVSLNKRMYVIDINPQQNEIILGNNRDLYKKNFLVKDLNFVSGDKISKPIKVDVKIRYNNKGSQAIISPCGNSEMSVNFKQPQRAITPGQSAVFYQKDVVVGGGIIEG